MEDVAREVMSPVRKPKRFRQVIADGVDDIWAMDLAEMGEWEKENDGYKFIMVVIDVFSRFAWCVPMKKKDAGTSWEAFETVLAGRTPNKIWVDQGGEFYNAVWDRKLKALDITRYSTYSAYKVSVAERFIRTLKEKIWFNFVKNGDRKWLNLLDGIVEEYNNTVNYTGLSPKAARRRENERKILKLYKRTKVVRPKFKLGSWVRIARTKDVFEKGFHPRWTYEIFKIVKIRLNQPTTYYLQD